jgi:undecaprenyl phosphate-alpha-L-ara4N flippase subunit ArnE
MTSSLSGFQTAVLVAYAMGMAGGQLLFKAAALRVPAQGSLAERVLSLAHNVYFVAALVAYVGLGLVWLWVLRFTPLSRAYLFVALSFLLVPIAAAFVFGEPLSGRFLVGAALTVCGLVLVVT